MRHPARVLAFALIVGLAGCQSLAPDRGSRTVAVDPSAAAAIISAFRAEQGLGPVRVSPTLNAIARHQATAMAGRDRMSHDVAGALAGRIERGGYGALTAAENLAAGQRNLGEVFSGWQGSASHRANLLRAAVTEIGIAAASSNAGRDRNYWALVLAAPLR